MNKIIIVAYRLPNCGLLRRFLVSLCWIVVQSVFVSPDQMNSNCLLKIVSFVMSFGSYFGVSCNVYTKF